MNGLRFTETNCKFQIYQYKKDYLKAEEKNHRYPSFRGYEDLQHLNLQLPNVKNYDLVYEDSIRTTYAETDPILGMIYEKFNLYRPIDYRGHSLSIGDVIVFTAGKRAYFIDDFGFKRIENFFEIEEEDEDEKMRIEYLELAEDIRKNGCCDAKKRIKQLKRMIELAELTNF